jgi:hypothetical protein
MIGGMVALLTRSNRVSNRRFVETTGWAPTVPTAPMGWTRLVDDGLEPPHEWPRPA